VNTVGACRKDYKSKQIYNDVKAHNEIDPDPTGNDNVLFPTGFP